MAIFSTKKEFKKNFPTQNEYKLSLLNNNLFKIFLPAIFAILLLFLNIYLIIIDDKGLTEILFKYNLVGSDFNTVSLYKIFLNISLCLQTLIYIAYVLIIFVLNYQTKNSIINFKESNLETLLTLLARILRIEKQARFTIFQTEKNDENKITIIYRKHIGRNKAGYNDDFSFIDGEGLPGKAKQDPFIIGKTSNDSISFLRKLHISHLPDHLPKISSLSSLTPEIERNFKDFFKKTHNIESLKFGEMSSYKYKARSYLAVGLMPQSLKNTAVLVIDSENENVFLDLEMLKKLFSQAVFANITFEQLIVRKELRKLTTIKVGQALNLNEILFLLIQITNLIHQSIFRGNGDSYE